MTEMAEKDVMLRPKQVAETFHVHLRTVYVWIKERGLPVIRLGSRIWIRKGELDEWVQKNRSTD